MTFSEWITKKRKQEEEDHSTSGALSFSEWCDRKYGSNASDIAPVVTDKDQEPEEKWYEGWFQKGSEKGVAKSILGTLADFGEDLTAGFAGIGETAADALAWLAPSASAALQAQSSELAGGYNFDIEQHRKKEEQAKEFISKDLYDENAVAKQILSNVYGAAGNAYKTQNGMQLSQEDILAQKEGRKVAQEYLDNDMEKDSYLGEKTDSVVKSAGQMLGTRALSALGIPADVVIGLTSFGSEAENAFKQGASYEEAGLSAAISAGSEILSEKISGGIKFGGKTLDDGATKWLARNITNKAGRTLLKMGMDVAGEGLEEVLSGIMGAVGQKLTYMSEEELSELFTKEDAWEAFIGGAALGAVGSVSQTVKSKMDGTDAVTGLTQNEQKVVDKVYNDRVAEESKGGKKVTEKRKAEIYDQVAEEMDKGYISTDTIEEVLGKDSLSKYDALSKEADEFKTLYETEGGKLSEKQRDRLAELKAKNQEKAYEDLLAEERGKISQSVSEMVKNDRLSQSYAERGRRGEKFQADVSQYDAKQRATVQAAIDSGVLNNTNRSHEFVDFVAKVSADKGVPFNFTDNKKLKETGFALEGVTVNGFVNDSGVTVNVGSSKALNSVVGHEITHVLEGTELYDALAQSITEYAKGKGDYDARLKALTKLYEGKDGYTGDDATAKIQREVVADLVGDYLFTDKAFVQNLSTENRNVFQKIWDEIKYLCKTVTAGSKEARQLLEVKKAFEEAYRAETKNPADEGGSKYSLMAFEQDGRRFVEIDQDQDRFDGHSADEYPRIAKDIINEKFNGKVIGIDNQMFVNGSGRDEFANPSKHLAGELYEAKMRSAGELDNLLDAGANYRNVPDGADGHYHPDAVNGFDHLDTLFKIGNRYYEAVVNIKNVKKGKLFKDVTKIKDVTQDVMDSYGDNPKFQFLRTSSMNSIRNPSEVVNNKFSLSSAENVKVAEQHFGTTYKISEAGYLLTDGRLLDFSGRHEGGPGGYRTVDHRDITDALGDDYGGDSYSGGMIRFMGEGNIRLSPESGGINLSVKPNKTQLSVLDRYITNFRGEVILDIDDANGNTVVSVEYPKRTYSKRIINDINAYFDNETIPEQPSSIGQFLSLSEQNQADTGSPFPLPWQVRGEDVALEFPLPPGYQEQGNTANVEVNTPKAGNALDDIAPVPEGYQETETEDSKVAKILFGEQQTPKQKSAWKWVREHIFSHGSVFEDLALNTGNRELQAKFDNIRRAESRAQSFIGKGKGSTKALVDVKNAVEKAGKAEDFNYYLYHLHNADRMTLEDRFRDVSNKSVFGDSVGAEESRKAAINLETLNPEFKQWAEDVYAINRQLRQMMVSEGIISQETADLWQEMYPHYVPISRAGAKGLNINVPLDTRRTGVNAPVKKATGGNSDFYNVFDTMGSRIEQTFKAIAKNRFGVELMNTLGTAIEREQADVDTVLANMDSHEELLQEGKNGESPTFTVFQNGEKVTFAITEEMYDAMKPSQFIYSSEAMRKVNNVRRDILTTYSPTFALTNPIKDIQDILLNSQHPAKTYATIPEAIRSVITKDQWYQERMDNGGSQDTYFDSRTKTFKKEDGWFKKAMGFVPSKIQAANEIIEQVPRMAEYIASRKMGRSVDVSMLDAARVTTNFGAAGDFTNMLNRNGFTFLGASVEGFNQQVRNIREAKAEGLKGWAKLAGKYLAVGLPALLLNHILWDDDEEYEDLSDYVKQNYYVVAKTEDGRFIRIPKGRTVAVIQDAFKQMENLITGDDEVDLEAFGQLVVNNLAPNNPMENNLFAPLVQAYKNQTWYGDELVPTRLQDVPAAEQYDETTDSLSRWLGEATNTSPYKWNYLLDQYTGGVGDLLLPYLTPEADGGGLGAAFRDKFTTDPVLKNQNVSDFYDKMDELTVNANSMYATDEDVLMSKYMSGINSRLSELYQQKREIQNSDMSDEEKHEAVRQIQEQINEMAEEGLGSYGDVSIEGAYATVGDQQFRWYEPGENSDAEPGWKRLTADQIAKQVEVTEGFGIDASEYWSHKDEYDYAYEYPSKYALAQAVGGYDSYTTYRSDLNKLTSDKDENGNTISGSKEQKVLDYINGLDAEYGEKVILYVSEYSNQKNRRIYGHEIIDYLNSRDDISYSQMEAILIELGFDVDENGYVTWD